MAIDVVAGAPEDSTIMDEAGAKKSPFKKVIIIVPVVLLLLAVEITGAYYTISWFFFSNMPSQEESAVVSDTSQAIVSVNQEKLEKGQGELFEFADIIVNPAGTAGRRYLVVSMTFETSNKKVLVELAEKGPILRDALITFLASKTFDYVADVANLENLRSEMLNILNQYLQKGRVVRIYFTGYILQ
ncbi:MAG: flagellar basal body-associated FliL family protein [candidate division Zixibacteria bacterium]|nr:flagellar basal body-associated FliL family protein [Candidatus Tariuqbacter arcticus]